MPLSKNELSPTKDATCAPPTLQGSVYDADTLDIPPPIATPRAHPAALEAEVYIFLYLNYEADFLSECNNYAGYSEICICCTYIIP